MCLRLAKRTFHVCSVLLDLSVVVVVFFLAFVFACLMAVVLGWTDKHSQKAKKTRAV